MKQRRRYVVFEATEDAEKADVFEAAVSLNRLLGVDRTQARMILYDQVSHRGLFFCSHRRVDELKAAMGNLRIFKVLGVSGTVRSAKQKFLQNR